MTTIKEEIIGNFINHRYEQCQELFDKYFKTGYGIDFELIVYYIKLLNRNRHYADSYRMLKLLEKGLYSYPEIASDLFEEYYHSFNHDDAERMLNTGLVREANIANVVETFMCLGKVEKAKELLDRYMQTSYTERLGKLRTEIENHERYGAFLRIDYKPFVKNGGRLEPGHVVYLNNEPDSDCYFEEEAKLGRRPYLIWKIDEDDIHLFPLTSRVSVIGKYVLKKAKYLNADCDRTVIDKSCTTKEDNVRIVIDKIDDRDLKEVLTTTYNFIYYSNDRVQKEGNKEFMQEFHQELEKHNVICTIDKNTRARKYYYIVDVKDDSYIVVEIDHSLRVLDDKAETFKKDRLFFKAYAPSSEQIDRISSQLPPHLLVTSLLGATVEVNNNRFMLNGRYIVIYEKGDFCIGITELHSPTWFRVVTFKKEDIKNTFGCVSEEEVQDIVDMVNRNNKVTIQMMAKKLK